MTNDNPLEVENLATRGRTLKGLSGDELYDALHPKPGEAATKTDLLSDLRKRARDRGKPSAGDGGSAA